MDAWQLQDTSAAAYERYLVPAFFAPFAERLVELCGPGPGDRILDVACGTGIVARLAARQAGSSGALVGVDLNAGMLEVARVAAAGSEPSIEWMLADAADMPLPDSSFDCVLCQQGLQFFGDRSAALREMQRVLAPGGRLTLGVWRAIEHNPVFPPLVDALGRHAGPEAAEIMRSPFAGPGSDELRELVADAGFHDVHVRIRIESVRFPSPREFVLREAASSPLAGLIAALGDAGREALVHDVAETISSCTDDDGVVFPMETWIATASV
jgi:ubiquinone/menaquinone biosynthesis C-methylase UbiE